MPSGRTGVDPVQWTPQRKVWRGSAVASASLRVPHELVDWVIASARAPKSLRPLSTEPKVQSPILDPVRVDRRRSGPIAVTRYPKFHSGLQSFARQAIRDVSPPIFPTLVLTVRFPPSDNR